MPNRSNAGAALGGLMHLAGVLADGVLPSLTRESLDKSYGPKARGRAGARAGSAEASDLQKEMGGVERSRWFSAAT